MEIIQIPVLRDNYVYLIHDPVMDMTAAVDPAESDAVLAEINRRGWRLTHILNTHHHSDHIGGNLALKQATGCEVVGASDERERITGLDHAVNGGDRLSLGRCVIEVLSIPGHTRTHIGFWLPEQQILFCGDTLFGMGCGRILGGTATQLWASLNRLRQLPETTLIYCAHEYTQNNGRFALSVEPGNEALRSRMQHIDDARARGEPTVPFRLQEELKTNPFLRPESPDIRSRLGMVEASDLAVFSELRARKDVF